MQPYFQTTPFTCAASSLLTILHHFNPQIKLNRENEFKIWQKSALLPTRASCIFALANYAQETGLNPRIIVEKKEYDFPDYRFYRYKKEDIDNAKFTSQLNLKEAERKNISILEKEINLQDIKNELDDNNLIILRINTKPIRNEKKNTSNYIIVHGYQENYFHLIDPSLGALSVPETVFREAFETLETKKFRDHRMLIFSQ
ncbi:MAG: peptidase C39 family protein [Nanoarchaeota archaeon]|nr:peptidase C39 family protein [Nanoarchaeota archaeon]MBU1622314.1 peptidase C39 family protein [Nanoarchaeota archaeon]MBU1974336.1 peptidase C39 family protein [Nanoarchaeota archaeon]